MQMLRKGSGKICNKWRILLASEKEHVSMGVFVDREFNPLRDAFTLGPGRRSHVFLVELKWIGKTLYIK